MSTHKLSNIPLGVYRKFLQSQGCKLIRTSGGHEHWSRTDIPRSLTLQTHISPVPERIIKQHLAYLKIDRDKFFQVLQDL
jgi:hypothetical protein